MAVAERQTPKRQRSWETFVRLAEQTRDTLEGSAQPSKILFIGILVIAVWWVMHKGERLALSEREVLLERGLLSKQRTEVALGSIRSVRITQSLGQRIFDVGHVEMFSAGDVAEIAIKNMPRPGRIRALAAARNLDLLPQR